MSLWQAERGIYEQVVEAVHWRARAAKLEAENGLLREKVFEQSVELKSAHDALEEAKETISELESEVLSLQTSRRSALRQKEAEWQQARSDRSKEAVDRKRRCGFEASEDGIHDVFVHLLATTMTSEV